MGVWRGLAWAPVGKGVGAARALATHGVEKVEGAYGSSSQIGLADMRMAERAEIPPAIMVGRLSRLHLGWNRLQLSAGI